MSDCELPQFYYETFPKARKQHRCCECRAPIVVGEKHLHWRGKWDGELSNGRQHMLCREVCMLLGNETDDGCFGFGELRFYWSEMAWGRREYKREEPFVQARKLMAQIVRRERATRPPLTKGER